MSNEPRKLFTLASANDALAFVGRVVGDIVALNDEVSVLYREGRGRTGTRSDAGEGPDGASAARLRRLLDARAECIDELERVGCVLKDPGVGRVDFPARHEGRVVYLCWQHGEPEVAWWHEIHAGFRGRRPVGQLRFDD